MAATNQTVSGVPGRYASALFDLATEAKAVDRVGADLATFGTAMGASEDLRRLIRSPVYSADDQIAAIDAIAGAAGIAGTALNFIRLAAKNRRLAALPDMIRAYSSLVAASKGEVEAEVTSAEALSDKHAKELKAALKAALGRDTQLALKVDPAILGGLVVKVGSRMMDNSLRTKLQNLKIAMKGTA